MPEETEEKHEPLPVRTVGILAKIRIRYLTDTNHKHYSLNGINDKSEVCTIKSNRLF
jgi:hypothetical protein